MKGKHKTDSWSGPTYPSLVHFNLKHTFMLQFCMLGSYLCRYEMVFMKTKTSSFMVLLFQKVVFPLLDCSS